jgi:hypothetical protein
MPVIDSWGKEIRSMRWSLSACILALAVAATLAAPAPEKKKATDEDVAKAEKLVKEFLEKKKGAHANIQVVKDESLSRTFPDVVFITALFRQFPVARPLPEGLKSSNVFAVGLDGAVQLLGEGKELETFFKKNLDAQSDDAAKDAVRSWLRLSPEFRQDGFYKFVLMDDSTKVASSGQGKEASGKVVVMQGGNGEISVTLALDDKGKLTKVEESAKIRPGPRPICQATKLLDNDPIVRRMAEQDLLIMGKAAHDYLQEQRAKANPALQKAIDQLWQRIDNTDR